MEAVGHWKGFGIFQKVLLPQKAEPRGEPREDPIPKLKISHSQSKWVIMRAIMEEREEGRLPEFMTPNIKIAKHIRKSKSSIIEETGACKG
ncbi:unnamed protein product [Calypogeia fissa]